MVNRVNGNDYYDYSQLKMPEASDKMENGEKFSLNYQRAKEESDKKDKDKTDEKGDGVGIARGQRTLMQGGVRLELSGDGTKDAGEAQSRTEQDSLTGQKFLETVRSWAAMIVQGLKDFFYKIWNDAPAQEIVQTQEEPGENEKLTEEYLALNPAERAEGMETPQMPEQKRFHSAAEKDKEIQKYLHSGNLDQVMSLLTENGHRTMAKNSTLLTYYDRSGKIAPLSASDQERILHGDRNVKKL